MIWAYIWKRLPYLASTVSRPSLAIASAKSVNPQPARPDAATFVADVLGSTGGDIARYQVAEGRIHTLQVIVTIFLWDLPRVALVLPLLGTQILPSLRNDSLIKVSLDW